MQLALKVDVDTWRGTRQGVPRLAEMLSRAGARASFLFSLGPDHTGRAVKRVFRRGFVGKVSRTSVLSHYGLTTLLYGTLLPGPDIGRGCSAILRSVREQGFEVGIHTWDHVAWQDAVATADPAWTERQMNLAVQRFIEVFEEAPRVHGAAGWQMNRHAVRLTQRLGFTCSSDCRGSAPFMPVWDGEMVHCPQLPTTLPTLDEVIGLDGVTAQTAAQAILARTDLTGGSARPDALQVFTLHAELEGMKLASVFQELLDGWRAQGYELVDLSTALGSLEVSRLPRHRLEFGSVPGRTGTLLVQGAEFLSGAAPALTGSAGGNPLLG